MWAGCLELGGPTSGSEMGVSKYPGGWVRRCDHTQALGLCGVASFGFHSLAPGAIATRGTR